MLVLAWELKAQTMCQFSKEEWFSGFSRLGTTTTSSHEHTLSPFWRNHARLRFTYICGARIAEYLQPTGV